MSYPAQSLLPALRRLYPAVAAVLITGCAHHEGGQHAEHAVAPPVTPVVTRHAIAPALYELAYAARQDAVFVASAGGLNDDAAQSRVLRLDAQTLALQATIPLSAQGFGVVLDDESNRLYVGNALDAAITVIDTQTNTVTDVVTLAERITMTGLDGKRTERPPHNLRELVLDKRHHRLFAPGLWVTDSMLYVMDTRTLTREAVIPGFGFGAAGATIDERHGKVYVGNLQGQLIRVDAETLRVEQVFEVEADQLLNLVFDARRGKVLAVDQGSAMVDGVRESTAGIDYRRRGDGNRVVVIDPETGRIEHSIPTGESPVTLRLDDARNRLYVTHRGAGTVTAFDATTYALVSTVALPPHPNSLALNAQDGAVFVTVKNPHPAATNDAESVARITF